MNDVMAGPPPYVLLDKPAPPTEFLRMLAAIRANEPVVPMSSLRGDIGLTTAVEFYAARITRVAGTDTVRVTLSAVGMILLRRCDECGCPVPPLEGWP